MAATGKLKINQYTFMRMQYTKLYVLGDGEFIFNVFIAVLIHFKPLTVILSLYSSFRSPKIYNNPVIFHVNKDRSIHK